MRMSVREIISSFFLALSFLTRIPVSSLVVRHFPLSRAAWAFPVVGGLVGLCGGMAYASLFYLGTPHVVAAWVAIFFQILVTGGLHEDGVADAADGLAANRGISEKLAIMKDSRIGSYGVMALVISLCLRAETIAAFASYKYAVWALISSGAISRAMIVLFMRSTQLAKKEGVAVSAGRPSANQTIIALALGFFWLLFCQSFILAVSVVAVVGVCFFLLRSVSYRQFNGYTGDALGAMQILVEIAVLILLA